MSAWWNLTKKEIRLGMPSLLLPLITFSVIALIAFFLSYKAGIAWDVISVIGVGALALHAFYIGYYLLYSLSSERKKLHLWLHNPAPGYLLLLSKITAGVLSMLASLLFVSIILLISVQLYESVSQYINWDSLKDILLFAGSHVILIAIYFGVVFIFFWMIYLLFTRSMSNFVSFLLTFIIFIICASLYGWFSTTVFYEFITQWGAIHITDMIFGIHMQGDLDPANTEIITETGKITLYVGSYLFDVIFTVLLFLASCWILDKKVEV